MKDAKPMSDLEKGAKVKAISEMRKMATDEMSEPLKHLKKVTVASNDPEGIKMGLDKAKEMMGHPIDGHEMPEGEDMEEMSESPEEEHQEEMHPEMEASEDDKMSEEEMSPEELQAKIEELQMMLQKKSQHKY